jgi:hypothetical protein
VLLHSPFGSIGNITAGSDKCEAHASSYTSFEKDNNQMSVIPISGFVLFDLAVGTKCGPASKHLPRSFEEG